MTPWICARRLAASWRIAISWRRASTSAWALLTASFSQRGSME
jgi:hypothetical protein